MIHSRTHLVAMQEAVLWLPAHTRIDKEYDNE